MFIYRVLQQERTRLREGVPYVKLYRKTPKHLYPKLNGLGDNGQRNVWASEVSTYCTPSVTSYLSNAPARQRDMVMQWTLACVLQTGCGLLKVLGSLRTTMTRARVF